MDEMQILGGLLGCGVVSAVALGIIALNVSKGVAVLSQWTVDKDSPPEAVLQTDYVIDPKTSRVVRPEGESVRGSIQIGIKR